MLTEQLATQFDRMEKKIDALLFERRPEKHITARFQRNRDGQFVGRIELDGNEVECWLVYEHPDLGEDGAHVLKLSFTSPYK